MPDFSVVRTGTDSSGRPILMTAYMRDWWEAVCDELGFRPTIVQGAFMARNGGGATASAGYHDQAGCLDLRTWDQTADNVERIVRTCRRRGAGTWLRDHRHGMDPHIHLVLGTDQPLASGASSQWREYVAGGDGLAGSAPDYHWRPSPLVLTPPQEEDEMKDADWTRLEATVSRIVRAELDRAVNTSDGKSRSLRQMVKELWQTERRRAGK